MNKIYTKSIGFLIINKVQSCEIISFIDDKCDSLKKSTYSNIICENFQRQFKCTVNVQYKYDKKNNILIYLYCVSSSCNRKWRAQQLKVNIKKDEEISFEVMSNHEKCEHSEKIIRQLRGAEREKMANLAKQTSVSHVRNEALISCDTIALSQGHLQNVYPKPVIRKAISEINCENDKCKDPFYDIFLTCNELKCVYNIEMKKDKFTITILTKEQALVVKSYIEQCKKNKIVSRFYYDATGSIINKLDTKNFFHHIIVIPIVYGENDLNASFYNVGEMITILHTSDHQEIFLRKFSQILQQNKCSGEWFFCSQYER